MRVGLGTKLNFPDSIAYWEGFGGKNDPRRRALSITDVFISDLLSRSV